MKTSQRLTEVVGAGPLRNLHGCASAEEGRGDASPCQGLANASVRPQVGFGNPDAPILFVGPSPLDPSSATEEAFAGWLEHEADLANHLNFERVQPYFRYVRAVLLALRRRLGLQPQPKDTLELGFHTWVVRCPTANPDRVTEGAVALCTGRHLEPLIARLKPRAAVAMGGTAARYFWSRSGAGWDGWRPVEQLHGHSLSVNGNGTPLPVVLSIHPAQRGVDPHPEVIGRALGDRLRPDQLAPGHLQAA